MMTSALLRNGGWPSGLAITSAVLALWLVAFASLLGLPSALAQATSQASMPQGKDQAAMTKPLRIIAFGDSLTAGFGLAPADAFPVRLAAWLEARGHAATVVNAGVSGDTSAAGLERLDWAVGDGADAVIVELGANDALRGINPAETRRNLDRIVTQLTQRGLPVLIAGMRAPNNWGEDYRQRFDSIFADLASRHGTLLYPFFLETVALDPKLNQADGLHPNAKGIARIVEGIGPKVVELIARAAARRTPG